MRQLPQPGHRDGRALIRVKAFGLNRSKSFTRKGRSPSARLPRVLGIERMGVVEAARSTSLEVGQTVVALMGGMGREYDGGYAE